MHKPLNGLPVIRSGRDLDWRDHAACRGVDPDVFVLEGIFSKGSPAYRAALAKAMAYCDRCGVRVECGQWGATQKLGIYGGKTSSQRAETRRTRRKIMNLVPEVGDEPA